MKVAFRVTCVYIAGPNTRLLHIKYVNVFGLVYFRQLGTRGSASCYSGLLIKSTIFLAILTTDHVLHVGNLQVRLTYMEQRLYITC